MLVTCVLLATSFTSRAAAAGGGRAMHINSTALRQPSQAKCRGPLLSIITHACAAARLWPAITSIRFLQQGTCSMR